MWCLFQLGDNGITSKTNVSDLEREVKRLCPDATVVWGGPFKSSIADYR